MKNDMKITKGVRKENLIKLPKPGEHMTFLGTTGSGKTVLAEEFLKRMDSFFAIDTQNGLELNAVKITSPQMLNLKLKLFKKIRYVPSFEYRNRSAWNYVFRTLAESSTKKKPVPRVIYIDEIYHIGYGASFPTELPKLITTARQKKISVWISTQRPSMIPIPLLSECKRHYIFYLEYEEDIKKISKFGRGDGLYHEIINLPYDHSFVEVIRGEGYRKLKPIAKS